MNWVNDDDIKSWYVVFHRSKGEWWALGGYRHVSCFGYSPGANCWVHVNPDHRKQNTVLIPNTEYMDMAIAGLSQIGSVVRVPANRPERNGLFRLMTCVSVVSHTIGHRHRALTPWGFRRHLLSIGEEVLNDNL